MICVERLNGEILYLNWLQVELIEQIPETKIRMMNGDYYLVKDSVESIKDQVTGCDKGFLICQGNVLSGTDSLHAIGFLVSPSPLLSL